MGILQLPTPLAAEVGLKPATKKMVTTDNLATITAAGYLNKVNMQGFSLEPSDILEILYDYNEQTDVGTYGLFYPSISNGVITLKQDISEGNVVLPTIANRIATYVDTTGKISDDAATAVNGGNIQAGLSGTAGYLASYPSAAAKGSLRLTGVANTGDTVTTISNAAMGQTSVVSIPDPGQTTAEFIISDSPGTQHITSGALQVDAGTVSSGIGTGGAAGAFIAYPNAASNGYISLQSQDNSAGDFGTEIRHAPSVGQNQTIIIPDVGAATGYFQVSAIPSDVSSNLFWVDVTVTQADLAAAGTKTLVTSSGTKQYKIREIFLNSGGTNFAGGGGDRLGEVSDGTSSFTIIPAATMQSLVNARWGSTEVAYPVSVAVNTSSAAGANIVFQYNGGATDYTSGSLVISLLVERVA